MGCLRGAFPQAEDLLTARLRRRATVGSPTQRRIGFRHNAMFHPDLVSPLSLAPLVILVPGSDVFVTLQFQQVGLIIRISLSRVAPGPRAFALLQLHQKDGPQKHWLSGLEQPHSKRPAQQPPSDFGFLVALPLVRFKDPPSCALPPLLLHLIPSASATSPPHLANFLSSRRGFFRLRCSSVWAS